MAANRHSRQLQPGRLSLEMLLGSGYLRRTWSCRKLRRKIPFLAELM
jgi:hypothetical protein